MEPKEVSVPLPLSLCLSLLLNSNIVICSRLIQSRTRVQHDYYTVDVPLEAEEAAVDEKGFKVRGMLSLLSLSLTRARSCAEYSRDSEKSRTVGSSGRTPLKSSPNGD